VIGNDQVNACRDQLTGNLGRDLMTYRHRVHPGIGITELQAYRIPCRSFAVAKTTA
jgi:hypothetical protein